MNTHGVDMGRFPTLVAAAYRPLLFDHNRHLVLCGGAGSGKSHFAAQKCIYRAFTEQGTRHLILRKVARTVRQSVFHLTLQILRDYGLSKYCHVNRQEMSIEVEPCRSQIIFAGLDDPEKLKSIATVTSVFCEEASAITRADYDQVTLRLRGPHSGKYYQQITCFNPVLPQSQWLRDMFFVTQHPRSRVLRSTYKHNEFLDAEYSQVLEDLKTQNRELYEVYTRGRFYHDQSNRVFGRNLRILPEAQFPKDGDYFYGLDFGYNNPSALVLCCVYDSVLYCSQILYQSKMTVEDMSSEFAALGVRKDIPMYGDSATPGNIESLRRAGYKARPQRKDAGSVLAGINALNALPGIVLRKGDSDLCREVQGYSWREKNGDKIDEPVKFDDHAVDAMRASYYTHYYKHITRPRGMGDGHHVRERLAI